MKQHVGSKGLSEGVIKVAKFFRGNTSVSQRIFADIIQKQCEILRLFDPKIMRSVQETFSRVGRLLRYTDAVIALSHSDYRISLGGTEKVIHQEQNELARRGISYIQIYGISDDMGEYRRLWGQRVGVNIDGVPAGSFTVIQLVLILAILVEDARLCIPAVHIHHLMRFDLSGVKFLVTVIHSERIRIFIHDYYTICPQFNLLKNEKEFCGGTCSADDCRFRSEKESHFLGMRRLFDRLDFEVIAPSDIAAGIWRKAYPEYGERVRIVPHLVYKEIPKKNGKRLQRLATRAYRPRIAFLGREEFAKGLEAWWRLVGHQELRKRYDFFHLGIAGLRKPGVRYVDVSFLKEGDNAMLKALHEHEIDGVFLWSIWPETYSFTLYEAFGENCFVITNSMSGNIAAQIETGSRGAVFNDEKQLWEAMQDTERIKSLMVRNLRENPRLELALNPVIAEDTEKLKWPDSVTVGDNVDYSVLEKIDTGLNPLVCMLLVESAEAANQKQEEKGEIKKVPPVSDIRTSASYQVMDRLRQYCHKNRLVERLARRLVNALIRILPT